MIAEAEPSNTTYLDAALHSLDFAYRLTVATEFVSARFATSESMGWLNFERFDCGEALVNVSLVTGGGDLGLLIEATSILQSMTGSRDMGVR